MKIANKYKFLIGILVLVAIMCYFQFLNPIKNIQSTNKQSTNELKQNDYFNCVAGLLKSNNGGSDFVIYDTDTWKPTILLNLQDVSPDNYGAISTDGNYIAYTKWDENNVRRYLEIYSLAGGKVKSFYKDIPARNEIIKISWLPDNKTLLFIRNDAAIPYYQQIQTLNVQTGEENTLVKGEIWRISTAEESGTTAEDFYLKGHQTYLKVKEKEKIPGNDKNTMEWNYYLSQNDVDEIYHYYGGRGTFDKHNIINHMYINFSQPRCSEDGTKIIYSATLSRNGAPGEQTPLWMCSSIWEYNIKTGKSSIVYSQEDEGAIGRVDWINNYEVSFISFYDIQGSRDSINYLNLSTSEHKILFPYSNENYNNVTLLPVGNRKITFTTSKKDDIYKNSSTILFDVDSKNYNKLDVKLNNTNVLLENFIYTKLHYKKNP